jgi:hypothetical protein
MLSAGSMGQYDECAGRSSVVGRWSPVGGTLERGGWSGGALSAGSMGRYDECAGQEPALRVRYPVSLKFSHSAQWWRRGKQRPYAGRKRRRSCTLLHTPRIEQLRRCHDDHDL